MKALKSRKVWTAIIATVIVLLKEVLNLPDEVIRAVVIIASALIGGIALEDGLKGWYPELFKKKESK